MIRSLAHFGARLAALVAVLVAAPTTGPTAQTFHVTLPGSLKVGDLSAGPGGDCVVAYSNGAGSDVFALDAAGALRWSRSVASPAVPLTSSWPKVLAMPDGARSSRRGAC